MTKSVEIALNEYNKTWEYYHKITEFWNQYTGNFYKAATLFSAVVGATITWAGSDAGGSRADAIFPFLAFGGAISLFVLLRVGFYTIRMMATEIANSHIYLSHLASLRRYLYEETSLSGVTPIHIAREGLNRTRDRVQRLSNPQTRNEKRIHTKLGIRTNDRITTLYAITAAIGTASAALFVVGALSILPATITRSVVEAAYNWGPPTQTLDVVIPLVAAAAGVGLALGLWSVNFRGLRRMAENTYAAYLNSRVDVAEVEIGDEFFRSADLLAKLDQAPVTEKPA